MLEHSFFDLLAWASGALISWLVSQGGWIRGSGAARSLGEDPWYFVCLGTGAILGAIVFGSLNLGFAGLLPLGHSIAGAIAGGVVAVECYKLVRGIRGSTGVPFVAPLALGIAIGRLGCFSAGLPDYTYGTPSSLPWAVDFGDGIRRHPVQLYEAVSMLAFLAVFMKGIASKSPLFLRHGFYLFVGWYSLQRFAWEFLKPYPHILGPFNLFHFVCLALFAYSAFMIWRTHELRAAV